jgi:hypothetical protein
VLIFMLLLVAVLLAMMACAAVSMDLVTRRNGAQWRGRAM